ncbi:hypothetical protein [Streptomyces sp. NPDC050145]|uniref:hypothetical protein n=1 Tax=Streptomyces sp. NPDC050145 TaxID=3365602 RepID=UPI0037BBA87B
MQISSPPPRISANELRPGRRWYGVAAAVAFALIVLGAVIAVYRFSRVVDAVDTGHQFGKGDTVSLRLGPDSDRAIWVRDPPGPTPDQKCHITGPGEPRLTGPGIDVFHTRHEVWNPRYTIEVSRTGDYEVTCSSPDPDRYAIGDSGGYLAFGIGLVPAVLLPVLGVAVGAAITLVTAFRRSGHRKRLLAERRGVGAGRPLHPGW